jgi:hypothetical protein
VQAGILQFAPPPMLGAQPCRAGLYRTAASGVSDSCGLNAAILKFGRLDYQLKSYYLCRIL